MAEEKDSPAPEKPEELEEPADKAPPKKKEKPKQPVLSLDAIALVAGEDVDTFSLELRPGELALFHVSGRRHAFPLASLALGLLEPGSGSVRFRGKDWTEMSTPETEANRLTIGRVFNQREETYCWLQNLDIDENVTLAQSTGNRDTLANLTRRAEALAETFGLHGLPQARPIKTLPEDLVRAQWVRALLPKPLHLLVLEDPEWLAPSESVAALMDEVAAARKNGTAVIWITGERETFESESMEATARFKESPAPLLAHYPHHFFKQGL